ncbi:MAG TPA: PPOX class F420-dependent oxidoreductase [Dehalococcoidia bacterium]|nr:PPOX class F420-dependent oxidoreductase [Dehalococcoidia bacterium]
MAVQLSDKTKKYLEAKSFAHVATVNKDGSPQVSPVWIEHDGTHVIVNSEDKRLKVANLRRNPAVSLSIQNPENPYEYIEIRGRVTGITPNGGFEGIDRLAKKYLGQDKYPNNQPGDVRVVITIEPTRIVGG